MRTPPRQIKRTCPEGPNKMKNIRKSKKIKRDEKGAREITKKYIIKNRTIYFNNTFNDNIENYLDIFRKYKIHRVFFKKYMPNDINFFLFSDQVDYNIDNLPDNIDFLHICNELKRPVKKYPSKLKYLTLPSNCNMDVYNINLLPLSLKYLNIGSVNENNYLPINLKILKIHNLCHNLNYLPDNLEVLILTPPLGGNSFYQCILPRNLKVFINNSPHVICHGFLQHVEHLILTQQQITSKYISELDLHNLKSLTIGTRYDYRTFVKPEIDKLLYKLSNIKTFTKIKIGSTLLCDINYIPESIDTIYINGGYQYLLTCDFTNIKYIVIFGKYLHIEDIYKRAQLYNIKLLIFCDKYKYYHYN